MLSPSKSAGFCATPLSALVIDDQAEFRGLLVRCLAKLGMAAFEAKDGHEAQQWLRLHPVPGLIVCDLEMPLCNGWTFLRNLRLDKRYAHVPVLIVSGVENLAVESEKLGAAGYVSKAGVSMLLAFRTAVTLVVDQTF